MDNIRVCESAVKIESRESSGHRDPAGSTGNARNTHNHGVSPDLNNVGDRMEGLEATDEAARRDLSYPPSQFAGEDTCIQKVQRQRDDARNECQSLAQTLNAANAYIRQLEVHSSQQLERSNANNGALQEEVADLRLMLQETERERTRLQEDVRVAQEEVHQLERSNTNIEALQKEVADLKLTLQKTERERARLQEDVRVAQEGALRAMQKDKIMPMEDREVRERLSKLEERLRAWARKYSVNDAAALDVVSSSHKNRVIEQLNGYCIQQDWAMLQSQMPSLEKKLPLLLTQASLAKNILNALFSNPFFIFRSAQRHGSLPGQSQMYNLYRILEKGNEKDGNFWRSQMLRILNECQADSGIESLVDRWLKQFSNDLTARFLSGPVSILLQRLSSKEQETQRRQDLQKLIHAAGELAFSLWMQRTSTSCQGMQEGRVVFSRSPLVTAHRLHHLDEDDERLDGKQVLIVTHPIIAGWGDENGENYDDHKIWAKGIVCVVEKERRA